MKAAEHIKITSINRSSTQLLTNKTKKIENLKLLIFRAFGENERKYSVAEESGFV